MVSSRTQRGGPNHQAGHEPHPGVAGGCACGSACAGDHRGFARRKAGGGDAIQYGAIGCAGHQVAKLVEGRLHSEFPTAIDAQRYEARAGACSAESRGASRYRGCIQNVFPGERSGQGRPVLCRGDEILEEIDSVLCRRANYLKLNSRRLLPLNCAYGRACGEKNPIGRYRAVRNPAGASRITGMEFTTTEAVAVSQGDPPGMVKLILGCPRNATVSPGSLAPTYICNSR